MVISGRQLQLVMLIVDILSSVKMITRHVQILPNLALKRLLYMNYMPKEIYVMILHSLDSNKKFPSLISVDQYVFHGLKAFYKILRMVNS